MTDNHTTLAYEYLEQIASGSYASLIRYTLEHDGIIHAAPDCFCLAVPDEESPRTVHIIFQCSRLSALWRLARMYRPQFTHVRFRRDFKNYYGEHCFPIDRFLAKSSLARRLS